MKLFLTALVCLTALSASAEPYNIPGTNIILSYSSDSFAITITDCNQDATGD
jgi:hypothetical protein